MLVSRDPAKISRYVDSMVKEIALWRALIGRRARVSEIHFGGGTPSELPAPEMERIWEALRSAFDVQTQARVSIEVDPRHLQAESDADRFLKLGFNRISLGVQDFDAQVQKAVNRIQPREQTFNVYRWFKARGVPSINIDLIYGLPHQTRESFESTLQQVIELNPDRIALFQFAYLPNLKKHHGMIDAAAIPSPQLRLQLFNRALRKFGEQGYVYLGMDHFAKAEDALTQAARERRMGRNFQGYHEGHSPYMITVGSSSIGVLADVYFQNTKDLGVYEAQVTAGCLPVERGFVMSADDLLRRHVIERLMCDFSLDYAAVEHWGGICFADYFGHELNELEAMAADGLLVLEPGGLRVTPQGKHLIRYIAKCFDAYARAGKMSPHHMQAV